MIGHVLNILDKKIYFGFQTGCLMKLILSREKKTPERLSSVEAGVMTGHKALPFLLSSAANLEKGEEIMQLTLPVKCTALKNELLVKTSYVS